MPYITDIAKANVALNGPATSGELNYVFTQEAMAYLNKNGKSYMSINDVLGALEGCKLEFYHRVARPYEQQKCFDNGDVYG